MVSPARVRVPPTPADQGVRALPARGRASTALRGQGTASRALPVRGRGPEKVTPVRIRF